MPFCTFAASVAYKYKLGPFALNRVYSEKYLKKKENACSAQV